jgi:tetratricopeptide (TPR) repeat protein
MLRIAVTVAAVVMLAMLVGCQSEQGMGQLLPDRTNTPTTSQGVSDTLISSEADIVEQMAVNRQGYRRGLELLIQHYTSAGNNEKLRWAKKELEFLDRIPQYRYIIEAEVAGEDLKPTRSIPEADALYNTAVEIQRQAEPFVILKDDALLRLALDKYNQLIKKYPSSDKIDDAAYRAAGIYEYFKDYSIAVVYYQRTYQWNPETEQAARFHAAFILDRYLHRRAEALKLYQEAVQKESRHVDWRDFGERRIKELTKAE